MTAALPSGHSEPAAWGGCFVMLGGYMWEPFLSASPSHRLLLASGRGGKGRSCSPCFLEGLSFAYAVLFVIARVGMFPGGNVTMGWSHICLDKDRIVGAQLGFGVGTGRIEGSVRVLEQYECVLVMAVNQELCTAVLSTMNVL